MEPYLSDPIALAKKILPLLPTKGVLAIGQMNYMSGLKLSEDQITYLNELYSTKNVKKLWNFLKDNPKILFKKESIKALLKIIDNKDKKKE